MTTNFKNIYIGQEYDRPFLTKEWGYKGFQAISRGVITPKDEDTIILFVTKDKQSALTQYHDYIDDNYLHWEGEEKHTSDQRIKLSQKNNDKIHLFYREIHHTNFIYMGEIILINIQEKTNSPSEFIFKILSKDTKSDKVSEDSPAYIINKKEINTETDSLIKSRVGQEKFRDNLIKIWGSCSVTGMNRLELLKASHIKPWSESDNQERLDPFNGLLLIPNLDQLFDRGYISFDDNGEIIISPQLRTKEQEIMQISNRLNLRFIHQENKKYLKYHRDNILRA